MTARHEPKEKIDIAQYIPFTKYFRSIKKPQLKPKEHGIKKVAAFGIPKKSVQHNDVSALNSTLGMIKKKSQLKSKQHMNERR